MRDDKQYFYVVITKDDFPKLTVTHQPLQATSSKLQAELIGPFTEGTPLKSTLRILRRLFPYCTCKTKHYICCLNAHIGNCLGYCCLKKVATKGQRAEYRRNIRAIRDVLTGKRSTLIRKLEREMRTAGKNHRLERAVVLQRQVEHVRRVFDNAQINAANQGLAPRHHGALSQMAIEFGLDSIPHCIEGYDVANIQGQHANGAMVTFTDGHADNKEYRLFNVEGAPKANDMAMLRETIARRLAHPEWPTPDIIVVDGGKGQLNSAVKAVAKAKLTIPVLALTKNDRHQGDHVFSSLDRQVRYLKDLPRQLADLITHVEAEAHRFAIKHYRKRHSRSLLVE